MRIVLQRVKLGRVLVDDQVVADIGPGMVIFLGIGPNDGERQARYLAEKVAHLRIFEDEGGKTNQSILDNGGQAIVVSQFTLYADTRKGRRPSFINVAPPEVASPLIDHFAELLNQLGVPTQVGEFGAHMQVELINDGPMTIWLERE